MAKTLVYLDYNATSPLLASAKSAMLDVLDGPANASSVHRSGREARRLVEAARSQVAGLVNAEPNAVTFTSGATEADVLALSPQVSIDSRDVHFDRLYVSAAAHPAMLAGGRFAEEMVSHIPVDSNGLINRDWLSRELEGLTHLGGRALVALMHANNETGVIEPIAEIATEVSRLGHFVHVDAVQSVGRIPVDMDELGVHSLAISSHKLGGPHGAGALIRCGEAYRPSPLMLGGGQEARQRAGTENVAAIAGFGAAAEEACQESDRLIRILSHRDFLESEMRSIFRTVTIFGSAAKRICNTCCFAIPGTSAETLMIALDLERVAVSSGSACSSGKVGASHVLRAMGVDDQTAKAAIRVSLGAYTERTDIERFLEALQKSVRMMLKKPA